MNDLNEWLSSKNTKKDDSQESKKIEKETENFQ
jgi:endogenous inhibitor of DNA gyrase (YacG/DUF329 family)